MLVSAYAKTNLILDLGPKNSSGRFETNFLMQEIGLCDDVEVELMEGSGIIIEADDPKVPTDESNLCHKAAKIIMEISGKSEGVKISLTKRIPAAGGLGGGSADAAKIVTALNELWKLGFSKNDLIKHINPLLGTDTSFFIKGGTAIVKENGLSVEPVGVNLDISYLIVLPTITVSGNKTENVYSSFDLKRVTRKPDFNKMVDALKKGSVEGVAENLFNAFEFSLPSNYSRVLELKEEMIRAGCLNAIMCGAGPALFGVCKSFKEAEKILEKINGKFGKTFVAESVYAISHPPALARHHI